MTNKIPHGEAIGVVDAASIDEFVNGIFGVNKARNKKAARTAIRSVAIAVAYGLYKPQKRGR